MSDKIRISSIELENYRQYYGNHKINLSSRKEGFTIIAGKNGEGKSNLLNSISWCLYHQEPHGMRNNRGYSKDMSLSVINNRYITELPEEKRGIVSVKIWIEKGDTIYSISRVLTVLKHKLEFKELDNGQEVLVITQEAEDKVPQGCEILPEQSTFVIKEKKLNDADFRDTRDRIAPDVLMREILPKGLSKYFLLDGEFLEGFWRDVTAIREGVEQISQLHLLSSLEEHISDMSIMPKTGDREIDSLKTRINHLIWREMSYGEDGNEKFSLEPRWRSNPDDEDKYYHSSGRPLMKELEEDSRKMRLEVTEISKKIGTGNSQNLKTLKKEKIRLEEDIRDEEEKSEELSKKYRYNLVTKSPYIFLKKAIEETVSKTEERTNAGDLPIRQRRQFAEDLLKRGICICGESLDSSSGDKSAENRTSKISNYKDIVIGKDDLDAAVDMKYDFRHEFIGKYNQFLKETFGDPESNLVESQKKESQMRQRLREINIILKESGGEEAEKLIDNQQYLIDEISKKTQRVAEIDNDLKNDKKVLTDLKIQLSKRSKENQKIRKSAHAFEIWTQLREYIKNVHMELKDEIRREVQENTWKNFKELLANPTEFQNFTIDSDYVVYMLDRHKTNKIHNLSPGQSLILTLAFVAALREPTGYRFPLVVDSPLGKIDGRNRYNIGTRLPEYLPDEQLTLLVTDTEYVAPLPLDPEHPDIPHSSVASLLEGKIPLKHFKILKERKGKNTGNSSILPAKLEHNESKKSWVVEPIV